MLLLLPASTACLHQCCRRLRRTTSSSSSHRHVLAVATGSRSEAGRQEDAAEKEEEGEGRGRLQVPVAAPGDVQDALCCGGDGTRGADTHLVMTVDLVFTAITI